MSHKYEAETGECPSLAPCCAGTVSPHCLASEFGVSQSLKRLCLVGIVAATCISTAALAAETATDLTLVPFEQLLATEVTTAAKLAKQVSEASSAVSVVTAKDIKAYGYRTLGDILRSMRGLMTSSDSSGYSYLSGRGFGAQEFTGRISVVIDGLLTTDSIFGQSYFEEDGFLDVELIDRVEFIPGGGSAMYGNGAFLGVINIITKRGSDFDGAQVAQEYGSHHWNKTRLTYGKTYESGLDLLFSGSSYSNNGRPIYDQSFYADERINVEQNYRLFLKASYEGWGLDFAWVRRPYYLPVSVQWSTDENTFASIHYDTQATPTLKVSGRAAFGDYSSQTWGTDPGVIDALTGRWRSVDAKFVGTWFDRHTWIFGAEHREDFKQHLNYAYSQLLVSDTPGWILPVYDTTVRTNSFYLYDAYELSNRLELNYGFRYDRQDSGRETTSPRASLIYKPRPATVLKLSAGAANRQLVATERYWSYFNQTNSGDNTTPGTHEISPGQLLPTERVLLNELVWEEKLGPATRWTTSIYRYRTDGRTVISSRDPALLHRKVKSLGVESEFETNWDDGSRFRLSYAWQDSVSGSGGWVYYSPRHLAKANFTRPIVDERLRLGVEMQAVGQRLGQYDTGDSFRVGGYSLTNLTLTSTQMLPGWNASFSVRNVFNRSYGDAITMDGRNVWLQLSRDFK